MYQTYKYDNDNNIIIINEYDDLLKAYQSIDTKCKIYNFREYYISLFNRIITINEFRTLYYKQIIKIMDLFYGMNNKLDDIIALFIGTMQENDIPYFILNNEEYLVDLNNIIESELNLQIFIRKNPNNIFNDLKEYFKNHINEFLYITDILIENNLYDHFDWRKKSNIYIENNPELEVRYNKLYNDKDIYNRIEYDMIYSSSEYDTLQDFITDLDHIARILMDNLYLLKDNIQFSAELKNILRYI